MWIVMVRKQTENHVHVWLLEVRRLANGAMISTGRRTPRLTYDFLRGSLDNLVERLERAMSFLLAESLTASSDEMLLLGCGMNCRLETYRSLMTLRC